MRRLRAFVHGDDGSELGTLGYKKDSIKNTLSTQYLTCPSGVQVDNGA